jgi:hypothetical protein
MIWQKLTADALPVFTEHFGGLGDSVVVKADLRPGRHELLFVLHAQDYLREGAEDPWVVLEIAVHGLDSYRLQQGPKAFLGVVFSARVLFTDGLVVVDLDEYGDPDKDWRLSELYGAGSSCSYRVSHDLNPEDWSI